ncbi:MAG TPA: hypothetical protein VN646_17735 [Candidatus Acidoferrum sp.]|jgi:hypothetical protein|nr:hypothetical protein [Candidatus Acidoferrum sp.]
MSRLLILLCGLAAVFAGADVAAAEVRWYRYALDVQTGDTIYVEPLAPAVNGRRYRVETDGGDRVVRVATFIDARQVSEVIYRFAPGGAWPTGYDYWAADGEQTVRVDIHRDQRGQRTRQDFFLVDGRLANYRIRADRGDHVESLSYTGEGTLQGRTLLYYSADGVLMRTRWYPAGPSTYYDTAVEERTGLSVGRWKYRHGALEGSSRQVYDAGGMLTRSIDYSATGRPFGVTEYADGLKVSSRYATGGGEHEVRFSHDARRRTTEARHFLNGRPLYTLVYERLPNGRVLRSVALGPKGDVWAEYPDLYVENVERNGEAVDRPGVAIIYKRGPWWPAPGDLEAVNRGGEAARPPSV